MSVFGPVTGSVTSFICTNFLTIVVVNSRSHLSDGAVFLNYKKMKNVNPLLQFFYNTLQIVNGFGGT